MSEEQKICRICLQPFNEYDMGEKNGYQLSSCESCGSIAVRPWPTQADIDTFFGDIQPEAVHSPNPKREIINAGKLIRKITNNFSGRRFLDVSCRQGYAVVAAKKLGFQAKGIDPYEFFTTFAKDKYDADMFEHSTVQDYAARGEQAEVVFCVESFCEQLDPEGYMEALSKMIAAGGVLYIQEPDGNSFHIPKKFSDWDYINPPENFSWISEKGIKILLARNGLKIQKKLFTWGPFMRLIVVKK